MAVAGPASNLLISLVCVAAIRAGVLAGVFYPPESIGFFSLVGTDLSGPWPGIAFALSVFFSLNLMMACLNMIPLPPLDGSAAVVLLLGEDSARRYQMFVMQSQGFAMMGLVVAWRVFDFVFDPIFWTAISIVYPDVSYS